MPILRKLGVPVFTLLMMLSPLAWSAGMSVAGRLDVGNQATVTSSGLSVDLHGSQHYVVFSGDTISNSGNSWSSLTTSAGRNVSIPPHSSVSVNVIGNQVQVVNNVTDLSGNGFGFGHGNAYGFGRGHAFGFGHGRGHGYGRHVGFHRRHHHRPASPVMPDHDYDDYYFD